MIIQIILSVIFAFLIARIFFYRAFSVLVRFGTVLLFSMGIALVFEPDWTNRFANGLGVGRGADLFLYLGIASGSVVAVHFYMSLRSLEMKTAEVVRQLAILKYHSEANPRHSRDDEEDDHPETRRQASEG